MWFSLDGTLLTLVLCILLFPASGWTTRPNKIIVAPPRTSREWKQMAAMDVQVFDDFGFWEVRQRKATEQFVLQQYVDSSKRMKGNKYALLVATEFSKSGVLGMVEMGVSLDKVSNTTRTTIGVICVSPKCQRSSVGALLLAKCQDVASSEGWNETNIYAEVEPNNTAALNFFEKHGFVRNDEEKRTVTVRRRRTYEERPHLLLRKQLIATETLANETPR